jgi:hypothetical protein
MSTWQGHFRTNSFRVRDEAAFRAWVATLIVEGEIHVFEGGTSKLAGLLSLGARTAIPRDRQLSSAEIHAWTVAHPDQPALNPDDELHLTAIHEDGLDFTAELAAHLVEGQIAVVQEVGAEHLHSLTGVGSAFDHLGTVLTRSDIDDALNLPGGYRTTTPTS